VADNPVIPLEVLLGNPEKSQPKVSPDGERMSYIAPVDGVLNVWVGNVEKGDYAPVTKDTDRGVRAYSWVHDNRHLVYIQDQGGDENWRVYKVDLEKGETTDLTPFDGVQARIEKASKRRPGEIIVALNRDNEQLHDLYLCNVESGELTKVAQNAGFVAWAVDEDLNHARGRRRR
jgi:dipeptidyl aminopeptidase/acylaminoacyl peptidase